MSCPIVQSLYRLSPLGIWNQVLISLAFSLRLSSVSSVSISLLSLSSLLSPLSSLLSPLSLHLLLLSSYLSLVLPFPSFLTRPSLCLPVCARLCFSLVFFCPCKVSLLPLQTLSFCLFSSLSLSLSVFRFVLVALTVVADSNSACAILASLMRVQVADLERELFEAREALATAQAAVCISTGSSCFAMPAADPARYWFCSYPPFTNNLH